MSDWTLGYRAALADIEHLARRRGLTTPELYDLIGDLVADDLVIEREQNNRLRRQRLTAAREVLPLFAAAEEEP